MPKATIYDFGQLPFVYAPILKPTNDVLPDFLPFQLEVIEETGLTVQSYNQDVADALYEAYIASSQITGMMDSDGIGKEYADDFLDYIKLQTGRREFKGCRILDIGCGNGYLLHLLKKLGAEVVGLEPGSHGQLGAEKFAVPVAQDFFPSPHITGTFDIIVSFCLLEHIDNFDVFFRAIKSTLKVGGFFVCAVPDCEPYLHSGDISCLFHEHWNYFTEGDLQATIEKYTKWTTSIHRSGFGGTIYSTSVNSENLNSISDVSFNKSKWLPEFYNKQRIVSDNLKKIFMEADLKNESIGVFVPCRVVNILALILGEIDLHLVRFFDDNPKLLGTYYPGFDIVIESRAGLLQNPTDKLLIMSHSFGEKIEKELQTSPLKSEIISWSDIFNLRQDYV